LVSTATALSVTGNNIANVNTTGFKQSRTEFADLLSAQQGGGEGRVGLGTTIGGIQALFAQGSIESTGQPTDLAIEGNGFFVVRDESNASFYTRAGNLRLDENGLLVTSGGLPVQGFLLSSTGQPTGAPTDITLKGTGGQAQPTKTISLNSNLSATANVFAGGFDNTSFDTAYATANASTAVNIYDSLGTRHTVTIFFTKTGDNAWDYNVGVDAGETGGTAGDLNVLGTGTLAFNTDGSLNAVTPDPTTIAGVTFSGAGAQDLTLKFGTANPDAVAGEGIDGVTQYAGSSSVSGAQDGFGAGQLQALAVDEFGVVSGVFDNGQTRALYQLALASFAAPDRLSPMGNGLFQESTDSGVAAIGAPRSGGNGRIVAGAIESSNVDLAQQFIDLISLQKSFQANARVITSSDSLLNELINIVR
jgi:flagellar hook protein FlgE